MRTLVLLLVVTFASRSLGSLGETLEQTIERYGPVLKQEQAAKPPYLAPSDATIQYQFEKNGFRITVSFVDGVCAWILYAKEGQPIFDSELRTLLESNAERSRWKDGEEKREYPFKKKIAYSRMDGLANATYQELDNYNHLLIITKAWRDATSAASGL